jgi:predicted permease
MDSFFRRLLYYFRKRQFEAELEEEMQHHAKLSGRPSFGNVTLLKEDSRAMWTWTFVEQLAQDCRYALRTMANNKSFTALAALSLALGIGANTAIYSFMDSILLRSLPVQDPESLVTLSWHVRGLPPGSATRVIQSMSGNIYKAPGSGLMAEILPYPAFEVFQKNDTVLASVFAFRRAGRLNLSVGGQAEAGNGEYVSGDYFRGLGIQPAAGRLLIPDDDQPGAPAVAVVSMAFSQERFGGPDKAAGQPILINNVPFTVAGVTPPEFFGVEPGSAPQVFLPLHSNLLLEKYPFGGPAAMYLDQHFYWLEMMARLRPGVSREQAQSALAGPFHQWVDSTATNEQQRADLPELIVREGAGGLTTLRRQYSKPLYLLMTLVGLILAIACANIANLLLARATARRREMAVRLSIGAGRLRVIRQLLTESVLLAFMGAAVGVLFAVWGIRLLTVLLANGRADLVVGAELNWHVLAATLALTLLTGILCGLAPAIRSTRVDVMPALKEVRSSEARSRWRISLSQVLVVSQTALSLLILVTAGLFVRTLSNVQAVEVGFNRENLLLFQLNPQQAGYGQAAMVSFYDDLQKQFAAIPGVRNATLSHDFLFVAGTSLPIRVGGKNTSGTRILFTGSGFFSTMQIPVLSGRDFEERDRPGSPAVAIVNESFAKANFGNDDPLGQHITLEFRNDTPISMEIVGVSKDARYGGIKRDTPPVVYMPYHQRPQSYPVKEMAFELRTAGEPLNYVNSVRDIVRRTDPRVPVTDVQTQTSQIDKTISQEILFARLCSAFAILGLAITCVGLYGTTSYNVARRTNEIGIRMALGAKRGGVVWMVLRQVIVVAVAGLAIGLPIAFAASKLVESFLFGMTPNDPVAIVTAVAVLIAAAVIAGYAPARRASKIDPVAALRHE